MDFRTGGCRRPDRGWRALPLLAGLLVALVPVMYVLAGRMRARARCGPDGGPIEDEVNGIGTDANDRTRRR